AALDQRLGAHHRRTRVSGASEANQSSARRGCAGQDPQATGALSPANRSQRRDGWPWHSNVQRSTSTVQHPIECEDAAAVMARGFFLRCSSESPDRQASSSIPVFAEGPPTQHATDCLAHPQLREESDLQISSGSRLDLEKGHCPKQCYAPQR